MISAGVRLTPKPREITINLSYPGNVISVNHYLGKRRDGGYYVKLEAKSWMQEIGWLIKTAHIEEWQLPIEVYCSGIFKDARSAPDLSNISKCALDAIEEVTSLNDKDFRWHDGDRIIDGSQPPEIILTIRES